MAGWLGCVVLRSAGWATLRETPSPTTQHRVQDVEAKYYADGEDAYEMRKWFNPDSPAAKASKGGKRSGGKAGQAGAAEGSSSSGSSSSKKQQQDEAAAAAAAAAEKQPVAA